MSSQESSAPEAVLEMLGKMLGSDLIASGSLGLQEFFRTGDYGGVVRVLSSTTSAQVRAGKQAAFDNACAAGEAALVGLVLSCGGVCTSPATGQASVLYRAVALGRTELVRVLAESGQVDANHVSHHGDTALSRAADDGSEACTRLMLAAKGVDVNQTGGCGLTPLHRACRNGHEGCVRLLLAADGVDRNQASNGGATPLHMACRRGHWGCVRRLLATDGVDQNQASNDGATPLWIACHKGREGCVRLLLATAGTDPNKAGKRGTTPLYVACQNGHEGCARLLLSTAGTDPNKAKKSGATPLYVACDQNQRSCARLLLAAVGTRPNAPLTVNRRTPLHSACKEGDTAEAALVLVGGGDRFSVSAQGRTPLADTTSEAVRKLFRSGIDYWQRRRHGQHAHDMKQVVWTLLLVRQRLGHRALPAAAPAGPVVQDQQPTALLAHLPEEIWLAVCNFLRSADFEPQP